MVPAKTLQADRYPRKRMNGPHLEESVNVCCGLWMASCLVGPAASMSRSSPEKHWTLDTTCSYHVCSVTTASASQTVSSVLAARARAQCRRGGQSVLCRGSTPPPHPIRLRRSREPLQGKHLAVHWGGRGKQPRPVWMVILSFGNCATGGRADWSETVLGPAVLISTSPFTVVNLWP